MTGIYCRNERIIFLWTVVMSIPERTIEQGQFLMTMECLKRENSTRDVYGCTDKLSTESNSILLVVMGDVEGNNLCWF